MKRKLHSLGAEQLLERLTACEVLVYKRKDSGKTITYNGCKTTSGLMKKFEQAVAIILESKEAYKQDAVFMNELEAFKEGFVSERKKNGDVKYLWHRNVKFHKAKSGKDIAPTPKLLNMAELFIAIHRSQIVNLLQELS